MCGARASADPFLQEDVQPVCPSRRRSTRSGIPDGKGCYQQEPSAEVDRHFPEADLAPVSSEASLYELPVIAHGI